MTWVLLSASAQGRRATNDDAVQLASAKHRRRTYRFAVVSDGVGSRKGSGACASELARVAIEGLADGLRARGSRRPFCKREGTPFQHRLSKMRLAGGNREHAATLAAFVMSDRSYVALWAGDSRVYELRAGTGLLRLGPDHTDSEDRITSFFAGDGSLHGELCDRVGRVDADLLALCLTTDGVHGMCDHVELERFVGYVVDNDIKDGSILESEMLCFLDDNVQDNATMALAYRVGSIPDSLRKRWRST